MDEESSLTFNGRKIRNPVARVAIAIGLVVAMLAMVGGAVFLLFAIPATFSLLLVIAAVALPVFVVALLVFALGHYLLRLLGRNGFFTGHYSEEGGMVSASWELSVSADSFRRRS